MNIDEFFSNFKLSLINNRFKLLPNKIYKGSYLIDPVIVFDKKEFNRGEYRRLFINFSEKHFIYDIKQVNDKYQNPAGYELTINLNIKSDDNVELLTKVYKNYFIDNKTIEDIEMFMETLL